jgi:hypothetical protein
VSRTNLFLWLLAAAAAGASAFVLVKLATPEGDAPTTPSGRAMQPSAARAFADSVGVNVHLTYTTTPYGNFDRVLSALRAADVRHVRDGLVPGRPDQEQRLMRLAGAGIRSTLIMGAPNQTTVAQEITELRRRRSAVEAVEGPNEYDASGDPNWRVALVRYQRELYRQVHADRSLDGLKVLGPTLISPADFDVLGELRSAMDLANMHPYPGGGPPEPALAQGAAQLSSAAGTTRLVATETGYHNARSNGDHPGVSEAVAADYLPRLFLSAFADGYQRTFWYEFVDVAGDPLKPDDNFGLLRPDFTPKPAYAALQNLMGLVSERHATPARLQSLDLSISESPEQVRRLLLQKSDGTYVLALWRDASLAGERRSRLDEQPLPVRIRLPGAFTATVYRPSRSSRATARSVHTSAVTVAVAGDAVLVHLSRPSES